MKKRPNILLIMSDNHPAELLGCYGNPEIYTPHLDRLAEEGAQFNQAYAVNAMCSPGRASVLTGRMPSQHGIHTWIDDRQMDNWPAAWNALADEETLPEILGDHGYQTALIGKYHLGAPYEPQNGFDHWVTFPHGHTRSFWGNTIIENGRQYVDPGHSVDFFAQKAVDYVADIAVEQPFFLFLTFNGPYGHWPAIKGETRNRFADRYADCPMHSVPREGLNRAVIDRFLQRQDESGAGIDYSAPLQILNDLPSLRNYFSQMSMVDDGVGRVLSALAERGLDEDTVVIYTTDHGFSIGHHGYWGHAQVTMPASGHGAAYHIPLLMRGPGVPAGAPVNQLVSQIDLFATILNVGGIEPDNGLPARSLIPLLEGQGDDWENAVFSEQEETRVLRTREWLYVKRFAGYRDILFKDELYDLTQDPHERVNVIAERVDISAGLDRQLTAFFERHRDPQFDLWSGGTAKSNSDKPWLWQGAWGEGWAPVF